MQSASHILMIRPAAFGFNEQTAGSNAFQIALPGQPQVQQLALAEFDNLVHLLRKHGVQVTVINDTEVPVKPDAVFPNNWVSFHENGDVLLYPMEAHNRRLERREDIISQLEDRFQVRHIIDLSRFEQQHRFLEGTGSLVLDHEHRLAYACLSPRTDRDLLDEFCRYTGYQPVAFHAADDAGQAIYHTNVLMCIGSGYAIICLDAITNSNECQAVISHLHNTGREIIEITMEQLKHFAGNMLEVTSYNGKRLLVMSAQAYGALHEQQLARLNAYASPIYSDLQTIETNGGGSARCMMAEVFLPVKGAE